MSVYVMTSGIRGAAWTAAVKDVLTLGVVVFIGLYLPSHYFGGIGAMFQPSTPPSRASRLCPTSELTAGLVLLHRAA